MTIDQIRAAIDRAAVIRVPRFTADDRPGFRIERLEDAMLASAYMRGDLEEARLHARRALVTLEDEWDAVPGWETIVRGPGATQREVVAAKRTLRSDLYDGIRLSKRLLTELSEQIHRLELDERTVSRAYTLLTGNA